MFSPHRAALLSVQLLLLACHVFAAPARDDYRNTTVTIGNNIILTCNISTNVSQINWTNGRDVFALHVSKNQTYDNFTSKGKSIDKNDPLQLTISDAQYEDTGLYECIITTRKGAMKIKWNVTVVKGSSWLSIHYPSILIPAIGLLLCVFSAAVCLCGKFWTTTTIGLEQFHPQMGEEVPLPQLQSGVDNNMQRTQYTERINSIYGFY